MDAVGLLDVGRSIPMSGGGGLSRAKSQARAFAGLPPPISGGGRIGMSASSRSQLSGFLSGATALFNQLYASAENQEVFNTTTILALRSRYGVSAPEETQPPAGSTVDTEA